LDATWSRSSGTSVDADAMAPVSELMEALGFCAMACPFS
jgi:hypothetical protein